MSFTGQLPDGRLPIAIYTYPGAGCVCRYLKPDGQGKDIRPWCKNPNGIWECKAFPEPRPLYRLENLPPNGPIMLVEGEKCADALVAVGSSYAPISWSGGANGYRHTNWNPLRGRSVVLWPDRDEPGKKCMAEIAQILLRLECKVKVIMVDAENDGWDVADAVADGWDWNCIVEWAKPRAKSIELEKPQEVLVAVKKALEAKKIDSEEEYVPATIRQMWRSAKMTLKNNGEGSPHPNASNVAKLLDYHRFPVVYDLHTERKYTTAVWGYGSIERGPERVWDGLFDSLKYRQYVQLQPGFEMSSREALEDGLNNYALDNAVNRPQEWVKSLVWDKNPRLATWLSRYIGTPLDEYHQAVSKYVIRSMVARIMEPGCRVHSALVLIGKEGKGKSRLGEILGGEWYASIGTSFDASRDMAKMLQGTIVGELAENESSIKATAEAMKRMFTTSKDRIIEKYQNDAREIKRTGIFIITANHSELFSDDTGFRRFLPAHVTLQLDEAGLIGERDQLVAEAYQDILAGCSWWDLDQIDSKKEARKYRVEDPLEQAVLSVVSKHEPGKILTIADVLADMGVPFSQQTMPFKRRIGACLRMANCEAETIWDKENNRTFRGFKII